MSTSYQAKDVQVLAQQLKVEQLILLASNNLCAVSGGDLVVSINEPVLSVLQVSKQVAAGTLSGVVGAVNADPTKITLTGESAAVGTTSYVISYTVAE